MVLPPRQAAGRNALVSHFGAVADAAGLPVLVQDSPQVTGVTLDVPTLAAMAKAHPLVASVKSEIPGAGEKASAIHAEGLELIAGWGGLNYLEQIDRGAAGCFPGCDLGPAIVAIDRDARAGDRVAAQELYRRVLPFLSLASGLARPAAADGEAPHAPARDLLDRGPACPGARARRSRSQRSVDALLDELAVAGTPGFELVWARLHAGRRGADASRPRSSEPPCGTGAHRCRRDRYQLDVDHLSEVLDGLESDRL